MSALSCLFLAPALRADDADEALQGLLEDLVAGPAAIPAVLSRYERIESSSQFDDSGRFRIHQGLLKALGAVRDPLLAQEAERVLDRSGKAHLPSQVLILKTLLVSEFPAPFATRVGWLTRMARGKDPRLSIWGVRILGDSRWPEAVDALIAIRKAEEDSKRFDGLLWSIASAELFRLLGAEAVRGDAALIAESWEAMERKLPQKPEYSPAGKGGITTTFFGDRISPRAVFVIDTSSSMLRETVLKGGTRDRKIDIVKRELLSCLGRLQPHFKFNVIAYNARPSAWRGKGDQLYPATSTGVQSALDFVEKLPTGSGTNIHDSLAAALEVQDVETVYLLSDGAPSVGGGRPAIERRAQALNYLKGIRIITYGLAAEETGAFDEELMKKLAQDHRGWYRRLN